MTPSQEFLAFLLIAFGVGLRALVPAMRKAVELAKEGKPFVWNHVYTWTAATALVIAFVTTIIGFQTFPIPEDVSQLEYAISCIIYGMTLDGVAIEVAKWVGYI